MPDYKVTGVCKKQSSRTLSSSLGNSYNVFTGNSQCSVFRYSDPHQVIMFLNYIDLKWGPTLQHHVPLPISLSSIPPTPISVHLFLLSVLQSKFLPATHSMLDWTLMYFIPVWLINRFTMPFTTKWWITSVILSLAGSFFLPHSLPPFSYSVAFYLFLHFNTSRAKISMICE